MTDIYVGLFAVVVMSIAAFFIASRFARRSPGWACDLAALAAVVCTLCYLNCVWYDVRLARFLPFSNLIVVGNWFPLLGGFLAGIAWQRTPGNILRRGFGVVALFAGVGIVLLYPLLGCSPECGNQWDQRGHCIQTTAYTCSPACAATLLKFHGISATEQEMAELCLTRHGTSWMGLYHGLKQKIAGTHYDVEVVHGDVADLCERLSAPTILTVGIDNVQGIDRSYITERGWLPGIHHSVILLRVRNEKYVEIIDPAPGIGRELWHIDDLKILYQGHGLRLVHRHQPSPDYLTLK